MTFCVELEIEEEKRRAEARQLILTDYGIQFYIQPVTEVLQKLFYTSSTSSSFQIRILISRIAEPQYSQVFVPKVEIGAPQLGQLML